MDRMISRRVEHHFDVDPSCDHEHLATQNHGSGGHGLKQKFFNSLVLFCLYTEGRSLASIPSLKKPRLLSYPL